MNAPRPLRAHEVSDLVDRIRDAAQQRLRCDRRDAFAVRWLRALDTDVVFEPERLQIERIRSSVTQGMVELRYARRALGAAPWRVRFADEIELVAPGQVEPGALRLGSWAGRGDGYWQGVAARIFHEGHADYEIGAPSPHGLRAVDDARLRELARDACTVYEGIVTSARTVAVEVVDGATGERSSLIDAVPASALRALGQAPERGTEPDWRLSSDPGAHWMLAAALAAHAHGVMSDHPAELWAFAPIDTSGSAPDAEQLLSSYVESIVSGLAETSAWRMPLADVLQDFEAIRGIVAAPEARQVLESVLRQRAEARYCVEAPTVERACVASPMPL